MIGDGILTEFKLIQAFIVVLLICKNEYDLLKIQVAQWEMIAHHGASKMFGDTIIYDTQRQITLNLKL